MLWNLVAKAENVDRCNSHDDRIVYDQFFAVGFVDFFLAHDSFLSHFSATFLSVEVALVSFVLTSDFCDAVFALTTVNFFSGLLPADEIFTFFESVFDETVFIVDFVSTFVVDTDAVDFFDSTFTEADAFFSTVAVDDSFESDFSEFFPFSFASVESPATDLFCFTSAAFASFSF